MRSEKQPETAAAAAATSKEASAKTDTLASKLDLESGSTSKTADGSQATQHPSADNAAVAAAAEEGDIARALELWWDQILLFFVQHRATAAFVAWLGVFLFDAMDLRMPAEWLVFTFFSFSVFVQAFGVSILLFAALTVAMTILNIAVFYLLTPSVTSLFSTIVVCMLLVRGVHGLDAKGWAMTALMSLTRMHSPWCEILPDYLQAPIAAYCTSFGILWLAYHNSRRLERLIDPLCLLLGIIPPLPPRLSIVEIAEKSVVISWSQLPGHSNLIVPEQDLTGTGGIASLAGGLINGSMAKQPLFTGPTTTTATTAAGTIPVNTNTNKAAATIASSANTMPATMPTAAQTTTLLHSQTPMHEQTLVHLNGVAASGPGGHGGFSSNTSIPTMHSNVTTLNIGGLLTIDRKALREARVSYYEIEVDGHIVGKCKPDNGYAKVQGLRPASMYQIRVWAISESRGRAPSLPVFVSTHSIKDPAAKDNSKSLRQRQNGEATPIDIDHLRKEIGASQLTIKELEGSISNLKERAEQERSRLQKEIAELRSKRKEEESAKSLQRDKIRELEAEKRQLDKEKALLEKEITAARARKQKSLDRIHEQEKQAAVYMRSAKTLEETMKRERRDHDQKQAELKSTIATLKAEVEKSKARLDSLSSQHTDLSEKLKSKRAELSAQDKRNADLNAKVREVDKKRQKKKEAQKEMETNVAKMQVELDRLIPQLGEATAERKRLEEKASYSQRPPIPPVPLNNGIEMARPSAVFQPPYRLRGANIASLADTRSPSTLNYHHASPFSSRWRSMNSSNASAADGTVIGDNTNNKHSRSSSFASNIPNMLTDDSLTQYKPAAPQHAATLASYQPGAGSATHLGSIGGPVSRRSAEISSDLYGLWDRNSPLLSAAASTSSGIGSIGLSNASNAAAVAAHAISTEFGRHIIPQSSAHEPVSHLSHAPLWGKFVVSPTTQSTNTAEASALSILKDTDLAYPTPEQHPSRRSFDRYNNPLLHQDFIQPQQPPEAMHSMFSNGPSVLYPHNHALGGLLSGSVENMNHDRELRLSGDSAQHLRFNSLDIHASNSLADIGYAFRGSSSGMSNGANPLSDKESGRNSAATIDQRMSPCADLASSELGSHSLCSATPVDIQQQPPLRLSGDFLGAHRPHVEPIGAPNRRRTGDSPSPRVPPATFLPLSRPTSGDISQASSFGDSLYQRRTLWDLDLGSVPPSTIGGRSSFEKSG
ncbi:hypothetical protein GGI25_004426 [Coemansia spiralis]|uniref:Fibronectin type-III domain-containing protein n=2 Tax=Coemansia TaxID=4863 RepID=A0A9W8G0F6_9FUNG|nr:hypothetical protein EDC05_001614 [Coemansia umbellata]KAJ2624277.1 hypothetical protein GGI26_001633 [Coemansia sp. RSA 1358]KAJ2674209.1 hypothetical protein GGI25_004426 [Coemansia spiralis]